MARGRMVSWPCRLIRFFRPFVLSCFLSLIQYVYQIMNKYLKHTCSWCDKLIVLWTLNRQVQIFLRISYPSSKPPPFQLNFWDLSRATSSILNSVPILCFSFIFTIIWFCCYICGCCTASSTNLIIYFDKAFFILHSFSGIVQSTVF